MRQNPYALPRVSRAHNVDPHSPRKMADFGVHLAPIWGGRNSGPRSGHSQAVFGLFRININYAFVDISIYKVKKIEQ